MKLTSSLFSAANVTVIALLAAGCTNAVDSDEASDTTEERTGEAGSDLLNATTTYDYAPVVRIEHPVSGGTLLCTATAIADDMLVTAAHCVKYHDAVADWIKVRTAHGANSNAAGRYSSYIIMSADIQNNYYVGSLVGEDFYKRDIAFIKFGAGTFPSFYNLGAVGSSMTGQTVRLVAFGGDDTKEYGDDTIISTTFLGDYGYLQTSQAAGADVEEGDSGGPMLYPSNGSYKVLGVLSSVNNVGAAYPMITTALSNYVAPVLTNSVPSYCTDSYFDPSYSGESWSFCNTNAINPILSNTTFSDPFTMTQHWNYGHWNDQMSSLEIPPNTILTVFTDLNQGGTPLTLQNVYPFGNGSSIAQLSSFGLNDAVSSFSMTSTNGGNPGTFHIENTQWAKCIDVYAGQTANGTKIEEWDCGAGSTNQIFQFEAVGSNWRIRHPTSGKCLDVQGMGTAPGTKIELWDCNGSDAQNFAISSNTTTSDPRDFKIVNVHSGLCMDIANGSSSNGTQILTWPCDSTKPNQNFALRRY